MNTSNPIPQGIMPRKITIDILKGDAEIAEQGNYGGCAYVAGIQRKYEKLARVTVTRTMISVSDPTTRLRYHWVTPSDVSTWLFDWDHTDDKVRFLVTNPPPRLELYLRDAQVTQQPEKTAKQKAHARAYNKRLNEAKAKRTPAQIAAEAKLAEQRRRKIRGTWA